MKVVKIVAGLLLLLLSEIMWAAADPLTVRKSTTIDALAAEVWSKIKDFDNPTNLLPGIAKVEIIEGENNKVGAVRLITLLDGGTAKEKLLEFNPREQSYSYSMLEGALPVSDYTATISVEPAGKGKSTVIWSAWFKRKDVGPNPSSLENDGTALDAVSGLYDFGLSHLKKIIEAESQGKVAHASIGEPSPQAGMIRIPKGKFLMGCKDCEMPDALPIHLVEVDAFWIDEIPVTNAAYARFAKSRNYLTLAERIPSAKEYPDADPEQLVSGSIVFSPPPPKTSLLNPYAWWKYIQGANWLHPEGPGSLSKADHPVVHIAWEDAHAYCQWQGKQLPTEAEFEYAARGGLEGKRYSWGDELKPGGRWKANIWQGEFPSNNRGEDGYQRTSPVKAFPPNGYGLYDMSGNVWQWCSDWYRPDTYALAAKSPNLSKNPQGPADSFDAQEPGIMKRVQKGGSFLCSDHYCTRYLVGSRGKGAVDSASSNVGFRCVRP